MKRRRKGLSCLILLMQSTFSHPRITINKHSEKMFCVLTSVLFFLHVCILLCSFYSILFVYYIYYYYIYLSNGIHTLVYFFMSRTLAIFHF